MKSCGKSESHQLIIDATATTCATTTTTTTTDNNSDDDHHIAGLGLNEGGEDDNGPNDARRVVWAISEFFILFFRSFLFYFFVLFHFTYVLLHLDCVYGYPPLY
jgi:hypothetical protein